MHSFFVTEYAVKLPHIYSIFCTKQESLNFQMNHKNKRSIPLFENICGTDYRIKVLNFV